MNKTKLTAGIVIIFLLGCLTGGLAAKYFYQREYHGPRRHLPVSKRVDFIMKRLGENLELRSEQAERIRPIVEKGEREIAVLMKGVEPRMKKVHDWAFQAMRKELDPGQRRKLDELVKKLKRFHRQAQKEKPETDK